jgi:hypothetical protein
MATPPNSPDELGQLVKDVTVSSVIGASAMFSRIVVSDGRQTILYYVGRMTAAAVVSILVGLYLNDVIHSLTMRYATVGIAGAAAPEIINSFVKKIVSFIKRL